MKIGIFGGTFSPPHNTHVQIVKSAIKQLKLDKLFVLPAGEPPHKDSNEVKSADRYNMALLAFEGIKCVEVSPYEMEKEGKSYSYLTVQHFAKLYPSSELYLIIGSDSLKHFSTWKNPQEIAKLCSLAVVARKGIDILPLAEACEKQYATKVYTLVTVPNNMSSTEARVKCQFSVVADELPVKVKDYIAAHKLYSRYQGVTGKLKTMLSQRKYMHSLYTTKAGLNLNSGCSDDSVFLACALHDCAKEITDGTPYDFITPKDMPKSVVHAFLGAIVAEKEFSVHDEEILSAIRYHTTAKPNMSQLEKVVYVADKIEDTREYPTAHLKKDTLNETFKAVLTEAYQVCVDKGKNIYPLTTEAVKYYLQGDKNDN